MHAHAPTTHTPPKVTKYGLSCPVFIQALGLATSQCTHKMIFVRANNPGKVVQRSPTIYLIFFPKNHNVHIFYADICLQGLGFVQGIYHLVQRPQKSRVDINKRGI